MKHLFLLIICFIAISRIDAQQFKWVKGGGTNETISGIADDAERTEYMCTDPDGNVYAVSNVADNSIFADTFIRLSGAYGAARNVLITSYNCSGQMRWAKLIASSAGECEAGGIVADSLGHIYVSGILTNGTLYIGYDTTIPGAIYLSCGLMQFDTAGHFNWVRYVGDNTEATYFNANAGPLAIDQANNIHELSYMRGGIHITPTQTSIAGTYDLVYDVSGSLISSTRLDLDSEWEVKSMAIDPITNKLYSAGELNIFIHGSIATDTFFAAAFDANRNLLWQHYCGHGGDDALSGIILDQAKHLHFSGSAQSPHLDTTRFSFNGDSVSNTHTRFYDMAIILTTDTNGHVEWIKHFDGTQAINDFSSITVLPNNKVACVGTFVGNVTDGHVSLTTLPGHGWSPDIAIVDSEGNVLNFEQAYGDGFQNEGLAIASDKVGNVYIGGEVEDSIFGGTIPAYHSVGGNTDFFVMKYGVDCSCTTAPIASFTDTGTHHTVGVTYTGTTTGLDSLKWNFGDGDTSIMPATTHTYTHAGTYNICVTAYTECGVDVSCRNFVIDTSSTTDTTRSHILVNTVNRNDISVYPNPSKDELNISGITQPSTYQLFSVTGVSMKDGVLQIGNNITSLYGIAAGIYILEIVNLAGEKNIIRVVKQ